MKKMMQFTSVHTALQWYFNHDWVRAPRDVCSIRLLKVDGGSPRMDDVEKIYNTFVVLDRVLNELNPKQFFILRNEYARKSRSQAEVACFLNLSGGDRSVRDIRDRILPKLEMRLIEERVLSKPEYEEPLYASAE